MNFRKPDELEKFLRERILEKTESDLLDYKLTLDWSSRGQRLKIVKDMNAMSNAISDQFEGHGFIIFGLNREDGRITSNVDVFNSISADSLENGLLQIVNEYMSPTLKFNLFIFDERDMGKWGCIVIWPNHERPIIFKKHGDIDQSESDKTKKRPVSLWNKGDWFIRHGSLNDKPSPDDYRRIKEQQIDPLRQSIRDLSNQINSQQAMVEKLLYEKSIDGFSGAQLVRHAYRQPERLIIRGLRQELESFSIRFPASDIRKVSIETNITNGEMWTISEDQRIFLRSVLENIEGACRPIIEFLGSVNTEVYLENSYGPVAEALSEVNREILTVFMQNGPNRDTMSLHTPLYNAFLAYPSILLMTASASLSLNSHNAIQQSLFYTMFPFVWQGIRMQTSEADNLSFSDHWHYVSHLDVLNYHLGNQGISPTLDRMKDLFRRSDWIGLSLMVSTRERILSQGQMLVTMSYITSRLYRTTEVGYSPSSWMNYMDSGIMFKQLLKELRYRGIEGLVFGSGDIMNKMLVIMDEQAKLSTSNIKPSQIWQEIISVNK